MSGSRTVIKDVSSLLTVYSPSDEINGTRLKQLINTQIVPQLLGLVTGELEKHRKREILVHLGRELDQAAAESANWRLRSKRGISPEVQQHSLSQTSGRVLERQILLELAARTPTTGTRNVRHFDLRRSLLRAGSLFFWSQLSDLMHFGLANPVLRSKDGVWRVEDLNAVIDSDTWNSNMTRWMAERPWTPEGPMSELVNAALDRQPPPDSDTQKRVDSAFEEHFGFSLSALFALLLSLIEVADSELDHGPVAFSKPRRIRQRLDRMDLPSGWEAALQSMVYEPATETKPWIASRLFEHPFRLNTHPLLEAKNGDWLMMPFWIATSAEVYAKYAAEATWPHNITPDRQTPLGRVLQVEEQRLNDALETEVVRALQLAGLHAYGSVEFGSDIGIPELDLPGEIDVIAVDESRRRIWVIEAKDERHVHLVKKIKNRIDDWWLSGPDSHVQKLKHKVDAVSEGSEQVAKAIVSLSNLTKSKPNADPIDVKAQWEVKGVFVTREPSLAGVYVKASMPVLWLEQLPEGLP